MFFSDAGGQGCAAENKGVPVLCGLGRGSGTGAHFPGAVSFLARATETSVREPPWAATFSLSFSGFLVNVILTSLLRTVASSLQNSARHSALIRRAQLRAGFRTVVRRVPYAGFRSQTGSTETDLNPPKMVPKNDPNESKPLGCV